MNYDGIKDYTVMIVYRTLSHHYSSFLCEITYSNKQPEDNDVRKAKNLCFADVTFNENEAALFFRAS